MNVLPESWRIRFACLVVVVGTVLAPATTTHAAEPARPNVVVILIDDLGWADLGCYGSKFHRTPNLDRLAAEGMRFTHAYAACPVCSPTRAALLTGKYPARLHLTDYIPGQDNSNEYKLLRPDFLQQLPLEETTLAEMLKGAGYTTAAIGKWHLGGKGFEPQQSGFDVAVGGNDWGSVKNHFAPFASKTGALPGLGEALQGEYIADRLTTEAEKFIEQNSNRPFFLYLTHYAVHTPLQAPPDLVANYKNAEPHGQQRNPVYAAMVRSLDDSVGRIVATLDELKLSDNTILIFTSDNGGWHNVAREATNNAAYAGIPVTSNAPFRSGKASNYEGGTRVPLVVVWPGKTKAGSRSETVVQSTDFFPTLLAMAHLEAPQGVTFDGVNVAPAFVDEPVKRDAIFCHFPHGGRTDIDGFRPGTWVRRADWKLIRFFADNPDGTDKLELYDLKTDEGETKNLADEKRAQFVELKEELNANITAFLKDTQAVVPKANPNFRATPPGVAGWTTSKAATLEVKDGAYVVTSTGGDPFVVTRDIPTGIGPYTVELRMKSDSKGGGQVFWATATEKAFHRDRSVSFEPTHDSAWHTHSVKLPTATAITALRLDPSTAAGTIRLESVVLKDTAGKTLKTWTAPAKEKK